MIDKKQDKKAYAHAEKAYMQGTLFPYIKVGMQKVNLTPTVNIVNGEKVTTPNAPVYIYDTSCLLYTSPSPRDMRRSRMPSSA